MNTHDKLIAYERVGFIVPILPQDVEVYMDRELWEVPAQVHSDEGILGTNDIQ